MVNRKHSILTRPLFCNFCVKHESHHVHILKEVERSRAAEPFAARCPASKRVRMEGKRVELDCYSLLIFMAKFIIMLG